MNYLVGEVNQSLEIDKKGLYGSMDLGGESMEVAYYNTLRKRLQVTSYSYMGANQIRKHVNEYLTREMEEATVVNPCYPQGYSETVRRNTIQGTGNVRLIARVEG